jgi:hypothetical protein
VIFRPSSRVLVSEREPKNTSKRDVQKSRLGVTENRIDVFDERLANGEGWDKERQRSVEKIYGSLLCIWVFYLTNNQ